MTGLLLYFFDLLTSFLVRVHEYEDVDGISNCHTMTRMFSFVIKGAGGMRSHAHSAKVRGIAGSSAPLYCRTSLTYLPSHHLL